MAHRNIFRIIILIFCGLISMNLSAQYYEIVTSEDALIEGEHYLIVNTEYKQAISSAEKNAKNLPATPVETADGIIRNIGDAAVFKLEVRSSGYSFYREGKGYLCSTKSSANELTYYTAGAPNDYSKASITFEADNTATISFKLPASGKNYVRYNPENNLFNCYNYGQEPVSIFRYTASDPTKELQTLQFSDTNIVIYLGDSFTAPTLSGAMTDVTFSSSNTAVATVDENTGEVTIVDAGTTTITATAAADETYTSGTASYTVTVKLTEELFDFTTPESLGFETPQQSRETAVDSDIKQGPVTISVTHGATTNTRFYNSKSEGIFLGIYVDGGSLTFSVPDEHIIETIEFNTVASSDQKGLPNVRNKKWTGNAQTVTFDVTETVRLKSAKVSYRRNTEATHITHLSQPASTPTIYKIDGSKVTTKNSQKLPQGIYIINGKKQFVK